jgi:urate oxidase
MKMSIAVMIAVVAAIPARGQQREMPRVFIESSETVDASNAKDKSKQVDFGSALSAALVKKNIPVTVVTDKGKANWTIQSVSSQKEDSTGTKVTKIIAFGAFAGSFTKFEGTIRVVDNETSAVLFAYNIKKSNFQSAAEAFAKHFKSDYLDKKR